MAGEVAHRSGDAGLDSAAALADPVRRRLHRFVTGSTEPVGRDEAAVAVGISRSLAAYHLDQLVDDGLLEATFARRSGRTGPGSGRPAKLYGPAPVEVTVQLPPRDDTLVANLLARAVQADHSGEARKALRAVTRAAGRDLARELPKPTIDALVAELVARGYEAVETPEGVTLRNCPFHHLVGDHLVLVCALNHDLLGAATRAADVGLTAQLDPKEGRCCVVLRRKGASRRRDARPPIGDDVDHEVSNERDQRADLQGA